MSDQSADLVRWHGLGASPGLVTGRAHVVRGTSDASGMRPNDILVARHATPVLLPLLLRARAAVCETGGLLNHLAVLARELGKPCVTNLPGVVEALEPGVELRVDGTTGLVEVLGSQPMDPLGQPAAPGSPPGMIPIVQFGEFSAVFERTRSLFNLEAAVRTAALVSLPVAIGAGSAWDFAVTGNRVLVAEQAFTGTVQTLVGWLEEGRLPSARLRDRFAALCGWPGWSAERIDLLEALHRCVSLNQLTWAAVVAKDPLAARYRAFLCERLGDLDTADRDRLFLDSLIMSDRSYLLRRWLAGDGREMTWSGATVGARGAERAEAETVAAAGALRRDAGDRHRSALLRLRSWLSPADLGRAASYVACLADLVDLAERKNTDLHRCGAVLFGHPDRRAAIATLCGMSGLGRADSTTADARRRMVEEVLELVEGWGSLRPGAHAG
jgi:phosphohistidine swiveling domain-containing protein